MLSREFAGQAETMFALANDGVYRWVPSPDCGSHAFVRLSVRDQAGNVAASDSVQAVALDDLSRPRGRVVGISTAPRPATAGPVVPLPPHAN